VTVHSFSKKLTPYCHKSLSSDHAYCILVHNHLQMAAFIAADCMVSQTYDNVTLYEVIRNFTVSFSYMLQLVDVPRINNLGVS
jgi:hypothetical protein